jgi:mRNA interferase HicA
MVLECNRELARQHEPAESQRETMELAALLKLADLERHPRSHGSELYREGSKHSVWWNPAKRNTTSVPWHREVKDLAEDRIGAQCRIEKGSS